MINGSIKQDNIKVVIYIYAPNIGTLKFIKQMLAELKKGTDGNIIVGYFNTLHS